MMKIHERIDWHNVCNISNNDWSILLLYPPFYTPCPLPIQVVNVVSIFGNDKKVNLQSKGQMPTASWPVPAIFIMYICFMAAGQYD